MREIERIDSRIRTRNEQGKLEARTENLIQVCDGWSIKHGEEATQQDLKLYEGAKDDDEPAYAVLVRDIGTDGKQQDSYTAYAVDEAWTFLKQSTVKRQTAEEAEAEFQQMRAAGPRKSRMVGVLNRMQAMEAATESHTMMTTVEDDAAPMDDQGVEEDPAGGGRAAASASSSSGKAGSASSAKAKAGAPRLTADREGIATAILQGGELGSLAMREAQAGKDLEDEEAADARRERMAARGQDGHDEDFSGVGRFGATSLGEAVEVDLAAEFDDDEGVDADLAAVEFQALSHEVAREDELAVRSGGAGGEGEAAEAILGGDGEELTDEAADAALRAQTLGRGASSRYGGGGGLQQSALGAVQGGAAGGDGGEAAAGSSSVSTAAVGSKRGAPDGEKAGGGGGAPAAKKARGDGGKNADGSKAPVTSTAAFIRTGILDLLERSGGRASKKNLSRLLRQLQRKHGNGIKDTFAKLLGQLAKREASGTDVFYVQVNRR